MNIKRGKMVYVPKIVFDELEEIRMVDGVNRRAEAFDKMASYAKIGRKIHERARLERITITDLLGNKKKKKTDSFLGGGLFGS